MGLKEDMWRLPESLMESYARALGLSLEEYSGRVLFTGVGGSGAVGSLLADWGAASGRLEAYTWRGFSLPPYMRDMLVIAVSYSGWTAETLSSFREALKRGLRVLAVTSGGRLEELAREAKTLVIKVPGGMQPRAALAHMLGALLGALDSMMKLDAKREVEEASRLLAELRGEWSRELDRAASLALKGIPIVYGFLYMRSAAARIKSQINENAKMPCFYSELPELSHNEIEGFRGESAKLFKIFAIRDSLAPREYESSLRSLLETLEELGLEHYVIEARGQHLLTRILSAVYFGDLLSLRLADARRVDPEPLYNIPAYKSKLKALLEHS